MRTITRFSPTDCLPARSAVLAAEGMAGSSPVSAVTEGLLMRAMSMFSEQAAPIGVCADIGIPEFSAVFAGERQNDPEAPLGDIFPKADKLALFAGTVGPELARQIADLFQQHEYALGYVLDAVASCGTERLADLLQAAWESAAISRRQASSVGRIAVLPYSPGYCGWHVSGQRRLFEYLKPEEIGITLRESCLMEPLKSVSGVFVLGPGAIHQFNPTFSFCSECRTRTCRARLAAISKGVTWNY